MTVCWAAVTISEAVGGIEGTTMTYSWVGKNGGLYLREASKGDMLVEELVKILWVYSTLAWVENIHNTLTSVNSRCLDR